MEIMREILLALDKKRPRKRSANVENPYLKGNFAHVGAEYDDETLEVVEGTLPSNLNGTLYRMSPAPKFQPLNPTLYHWFDGDGMIDSFQIARGKVTHKNRWVKTAKLALEEKAGRALFGGIRDLALSTPMEGWFAMGFTPGEIVKMQVNLIRGKQPTPDQIRRVLSVMDRANTSIAWMAGRLLTLVEGSGAHDIDPGTLDTRGPFNFNGLLDPLKGGMVAHPKINPHDGTIYTFGYWGDRGGLTYHVIGPDGKSRLNRDIELPYPAMMHDFSVTESRAIFYHLPSVLHMEDVTNSNTIRWEPSKGARIVVVPRDNLNPVRSFDIPTCYIFHALNAYDDGDSVVLDVVRYPRLPLFEPGGENPNAPIDEYSPGVLVRLTLNVVTGRLTERVLDDTACEFPVVDPRYATRRHTVGWVAARKQPTCGRGFFNSIGYVRYDLGEVKYKTFGPSQYTNEPLFIPHNSQAAEGVGYLITTVYNADTDKSDLVLLDAQNPDAAPVAVVRIPRRVPYGFHGTWVDADVSQLT
ncbi:MAG: carotenoid oxygenase family protein [Polyangiaceae bacterium]|nr:carotenoid oxygenase family protein [Polyangiaceae bacterium]